MKTLHSVFCIILFGIFYYTTCSAQNQEIRFDKENGEYIKFNLIDGELILAGSKSIEKEERLFNEFLKKYSDSLNGADIDSLLKLYHLKKSSTIESVRSDNDSLDRWRDAVVNNKTVFKFVGFIKKEGELKKALISENEGKINSSMSPSSIIFKDGEFLFEDGLYMVDSNLGIMCNYWIKNPNLKPVIFKLDESESIISCGRNNFIIGSLFLLIVIISCIIIFLKKIK